MNFTFQDIFGIFLALILYPFVFVFPGYVVGWFLNLFNFRFRTSLVQTVMAMTISVSIVPAALFLVYRYTSSSIVISILAVLFILSVYLYIKSYKPPLSGNPYQRLAFIFIFFWIILSTLTLVDLQINQRLYFSSNAYDLTTRVSVVDAITRSGVPPVNPSYYPGQPVLLNSLYYYWYIPVSIIDQMGGGLVNAYQAMIASITWAGILLFATLATYLRVRDNLSSQNAWKKSFIGIQLFAIGGLDIIMVFIIMSSFYFRLGELPFQGQLEGWNMPIMSWMNALAWVPHHLAAALACVTTLLIAKEQINAGFTKGVILSLVAGLAFASAFGLSVWVMFVFAIFWLVWGVSFVFTKNYQQIAFMILSGVFAIIFVSPFILGIFSDGGVSTSGGGLPIAFYIRPFMLTSLLTGLPAFVSSILNFVLLPMNYLFELGFFFLMAILWFEEIYKRTKEPGVIYKAELILVVVITVVLSFVYSNIIVINDLGIRGWLPIQFILVVWSADVIFHLGVVKNWLSLKMFDGIQKTKTLKLVLNASLIIGILTMGSEFLVLRTWHILEDTSIGSTSKTENRAYSGERTYSARLVYTFINDSLPKDVIIQSNPLIFLDRPVGLYSMRQSAISDRTSYGIPPDVYLSKAQAVGQIFDLHDLTNWEIVDELCKTHFIDVLVITNSDNLWNELPTLSKQRQPLYMDGYYAAFTCGGYGTVSLTP